MSSSGLHLLGSSVSAGSSGSGLPSTIVTKTANYTAAAGEFVQANAAGGGFTVTLPSAPAVGALVTVKKTDATANTVTIVAGGSGTIDGDANATTTTKGGGAVFEHVGSNAWQVSAATLTSGPAGPIGATGATGPTGATGATGAAGTNGAISTVQDEGSDLAVRAKINFVGAGVTATDDSGNGRTNVAITGGGVLLPSNKYVQAVPSVNDVSALVLNREYVIGFLLAGQTINQVAIFVYNSGSAGAVVRIGIRADNDGTPGASVAEGTIDATVGGWASPTLSRVHPPGNFWVSITGQGWSTTAPTIDSRPASGVAAVGFGCLPLVPAASRALMDWSYGHNVLVGYQDSVSGALPSTFVNAAQGAQRIPTIALRRA